MPRGVREPLSGRVLLHAVGDVGIVGRLAPALARHPGTWPFDDVRDTLAAGDVVFGNLEIPFSGGAPIVAGESAALETPEEAAERLRAGGFHVLSLANNHVMDFGASGLARTITLLRENGIEPVGAGWNLEEARRPVIVERSGLRVGFLAYCVPCRASATVEGPGAAPLELGIVREDLSRLRPRADAIVVSLHFGMMYLEHPSPEDMELARAIVAGGANVVLGHHPHVLQGIEEITGGGIVAYSLGEFVFDPQAGNYYARVARDTRRRSMIFRAELHGDCVRLLPPIPTLSCDDLAPRLLHGAEREAALDSIGRLSAALHDPEVRAGFWRYAGRRLLAYQLSGLWFEIRRGNLIGLLRRVPRLRPRHLKLVLGYFLGTRDARSSSP